LTLNYVKEIILIFDHDGQKKKRVLHERVYGLQYMNSKKTRGPRGLKSLTWEL